MEDYLQGGLDFSSRFGMERHAQQCITCGKEMAAAQRLSQMVPELRRVKAPPNFEAAVLNRIAERKSRTLFSGIREFWIYGLEWPSRRTLAWSAAIFALIGFGIFYGSFQANRNRASAPPLAANEPSPIAERNYPRSVSSPVESKQPAAAATAKAVAAANPPRLQQEELLEGEDESADSESGYFEYSILGPDNRLVPVRLPKKIHMQYGQMSEEHYIQNVSH
jgi:hypothetical protein